MYSLNSRKTSSGIVYTGSCLLFHMFVGTDKTNDPEITIYDGTNNTGTEVVPTNTYDATALGLNGFCLATPIKCGTGIYVEITCGGNVEVNIGYFPQKAW